MIPGVLTGEQCAAASVELTGQMIEEQGDSARTMGGLRNVLQTSPLAVAIAGSPGLTSLVNEVLGGGARPVRGIFFDKSPAANWSVPWHQDLTIAVAERIETPGFGPWSVKAGIVHVQPPVQILAGMATIRLHLDACTADNGALRVIPGSRRQGVLNPEEMDRLTNGSEPVVCEVPQGGALLMRPLLLHASSRAKVPAHRRVLHLEYAAEDLPNGLNWFERS